MSARWFALFVVVGCADDPTQTLVRFEADPALEQRADAIRVRLTRADNNTSFYDRTEELRFELNRRLVPVEPSNDSTRRFRVLGELIEAGSVIATVRAETGFIEGTIREIWLRFDAACEGVACGARESCRSGVCGGDCINPAPRGSERPSPAFVCGEDDAGLPDAPVDQLPDVGPDASDASDASDATECDCPCPGDTCSETGCLPSITIQQVDLGGTHACAIDADGRVWCWGSNDSGQVGIGSEDDDVLVPTLVDDELFVQPADDISCGENVSGARLINGEILTWGSDASERLGEGLGSADRLVPGDIRSNGNRWLDLEFGFSHGLARNESNRVFSWGSNGAFRAGLEDLGASYDRPTDTNEVGYVQLCAGQAHSCGIESSRGRCWGEDASGRLGEFGVMGDQQEPVRIDLESPEVFSRLTCGKDFTCGLTETAKLYCWGSNGSGELGLDDTAGSRNTPRQVEPAPSPLETGWTNANAGYDHACAINDGSLYCWGSTADGALGIGPDATGDQRDPAFVGEDYVSVSAGNSFSCAIDALGALFCWGRNLRGQLGQDDYLNQAAPARVCFME